MKNVNSFRIHQIGWNISDHFPISVSCKFDLEDGNTRVKASLDIVDDLNETKKKKPVKIINEKFINWENYKVIANVELEMLMNDICILQQQPDNYILDKVVNDLSNSLYNSARTCETDKQDKQY